MPTPAQPSTPPVIPYPVYRLAARCRPHGRNPCPDFWCGQTAKEARAAALAPVTEQRIAAR